MDKWDANVLLLFRIVKQLEAACGGRKASINRKEISYVREMDVGVQYQKTFGNSPVDVYSVYCCMK